MNNEELIFIFEKRFIKNSYLHKSISSSWILTPIEIRKSSEALFGDKKYDGTFIYHNGTEPYYSNKEFRVLLIIKKNQ